jgi:hypothetical protein
MRRNRKTIMEAVDGIDKPKLWDRLSCIERLRILFEDDKDCYFFVSDVLQTTGIDTVESLRIYLKRLRKERITLFIVEDVVKWVT